MEERKAQRKTRYQGNDSLDSVALELGNRTPSAIELEEAVIGALLIDIEAHENVLDEVKEEAFYDPKCRAIFTAIKTMYQNKEPIDYLTVINWLKTHALLDECGGTAGIASLTQKIGSGMNVDFYTKILMQKMIQRNLIRVSYDILKESFSETTNVDELISKAQSKVFEATDIGIRKDTRHFRDIAPRTAERVEKSQTQTGLTGIHTGFPTLDKITMGWQKGNLIILGARPSVGKTAFALNLARNAAVDFGHKVAFFSLEMQDIEISQRLVTTQSGVSASKISGRQKMTDEDWHAFEQGLSALSKCDIFIDETSALPIGEFSSKAKHLVRCEGVEIIFVDYLQLMKSDSRDHSVREQEVATVSRTLKALAKELDIPIIALSQLSRASVNRPGSNGRPQLGDLRESGAIEQDADMVIFIHRPEAIGIGSEEGHNTEIIIAKHRNGELANIPMEFKGEIVRFYEATDKWYEEPAKTSDKAFPVYPPVDDFADGMASFETSTSYSPFDEEWR